MRDMGNNKKWWKNILALIRDDKITEEVDDGLAEMVIKEMDILWEMARSRDAGGNISEDECRTRIAESFNRVRSKYTDSQLDEIYVWPRFVKVAVHCTGKPVYELVQYVSENNYISLTKCINNLIHTTRKKRGETIISNMDNFAEAVCMHIVKNIDRYDVPSLLNLGQIAQRRGTFDTAREWFSRITETDEPFKGVTAILASYEKEAKGYLERGKEGWCALSEADREKIRDLNDQQCVVYTRWRNILEETMACEETVEEKTKGNYVALMTGYSRFERNRGNYDKAFMLLDAIPDNYPEMHRVYAERAMIYQFRPYRNRYYSLEKSIEAFKKAYALLCDSSHDESREVKGRKSILMPLANAYFQAGRYDDALTVCDRVLDIDKNEQRAVNLKNKITRIAA